MTLCLKLNPDNTLSVTADSIETCTDYLLISKVDYSFWFDAISVSPASITAAITFGIFVVVGMGFLMTYPIGIAKKLIRKI
ncbi:hypothetical protein [Aliivibrio sifiae]|uniref:Uncharacterized protein n=1 Tax=Aliivibrio sifiae TaxID=566293 RepID=A0A2S7X3C9_9GAMM|nr:hypothetical protein [Aliivibrio sifiae]PQJ84615.1 hypothetical protein BTO22_13960 [Aliivibrio sifiae]